MKNALEVTGLCKQYDSFKLDNVSLTIPGGTILGLIGENGAGKSTTIKCILNLIRRDSGSISLLGLDNIAEERAAKEQIAVVLDECTFHDTLRATEVGNIFAKLYPKSWDRALFSSYLDQFQLPTTKKTVKDYSKGMRTKLSIAVALSTRPRLLILDEATSGLDPVVREEILDEFLAFIQDESHAILLSSHITSDLERVADYITYLHCGKVAMQGAKDELLESYGRLVCSRTDLAGVEPQLLLGVRTGQFGCEALIKNRRDFCHRYPALTVDPVTLDEIMVFTVKGMRT